MIDMTERRQTIREFLAARKRKFIILAIGSWLGVLASMFIGSETKGPQVLSLAASAVFFLGFAVAVLGILLFLRCPRCKGSVGSNNAPLLRDHFGLMGRRINFCPYCGVSLDEPYETQGTSRHIGPLA